MDLVIAKRLQPDISNIEDNFSKELVKLWKDRQMSGTVFSVCENTKKRSPTLGYILLEETKNRHTIRGFWVSKDYRGKGLGTELLNSTCAWCDTFGVSEIFVNITESSQNIYIYQNQGFKIIGPRQDFPEQLKAVRYGKNFIARTE